MLAEGFTNQQTPCGCVILEFATRAVPIRISYLASPSFLLWIFVIFVISRMASGITILRIAYTVLILSYVARLLYATILTGHFAPPYLTPLVYSFHETMQLSWLQSLLSIWPVAYYFIVGIEVLYLGRLFVTDCLRSEKIDKSLSTRIFWLRCGYNI